MSIYMLTDKLGITSDAYNWILIKNPKKDKTKSGWKGKHSYYSNFRQMSRAIVDDKLKEIMGSEANTELVLTNIESKLEQFLQETITKEKLNG